MNKVLLTGRLTRDPEMRSLSSAKAVTQFIDATNEYIGQGKEEAEFQYKGKVYLSEERSQKLAELPVAGLGLRGGAVRLWQCGRACSGVRAGLRPNWRARTAIIA